MSNEKTAEQKQQEKDQELRAQIDGMGMDDLRVELFKKTKYHIDLSSRYVSLESQHRKLISEKSKIESHRDDLKKRNALLESEHAMMVEVTKLLVLTKADARTAFTVAHKILSQVFSETPTSSRLADLIDNVLKKKPVKKR